MGISVPTVNLKKWDFVNVSTELNWQLTANFIKYLHMTDQDFTDIDELFYYMDIQSGPNIDFTVAIDLNQSTVLYQSPVVTGTQSEYRGFIDVSSYNAVQELGVLLDATGAGIPGAISVHEFRLWGKKTLL